MPQKPLFQPPPKLDPNTPQLPPATDAGVADLLMEAILSPLGLGTDTSDPEMVTPGSPAQHKLLRAGAAGELGSMAGPAAGMMLLRPSNIFRNLNKVLTTAPDEMAESLGQVARRHPRTMGHIQELAVDDAPISAMAGFASSPKLGVPYDEGVGAIGIQKSLAERGTEFDQISALAHELTHGAQQIRRPGTADQRYDIHSLLYGYGNNPAEVSARVTGNNQANRAFWDARNTSEQPLIPGLIRRKDIKKWAEGATKAEFESPANIANYSLRLQGNRIDNDPQMEAMRRAVLREKFGSSPKEKQGRLPIDTTGPAGPEFTAVGDEPPRMAPERKPVSAYPERPPYREPRYDKPLGQPMVIDAPELTSVFGRRVQLRLGDEPALIWPDGGGHKNVRNPLIEPVSKEVIDHLLLELQRRQRGYMVTADGRKRPMPGKK